MLISCLLLSTQDQDALLDNNDSSTSDDDESSALSNDDESSISDSESSSSDSEADESSSESEYEYDVNEMSSDDESPTAPNEGEEGNQVTDDSFESNSSGNDGSSSDEPEPKRLRHEPDGGQSNESDEELSEQDDQGQDEHAQREPVRPQGADTGVDTRPFERNDPSATYDRIYQLATDPNQTPVIESCPTAVPDFIAQNCPYNSQIDNACNQVGLNRAFTDCLGEGRHDIVFGCFANYCPTTREQAFNERILHKVTKVSDDGTVIEELVECWKHPVGLLRDIMVGEYNMQEQGMFRGDLLSCTPLTIKPVLLN